MESSDVAMLSTTGSSRSETSQWGYTRFRDYRDRKNEVAAAWFKRHGKVVSDRYPYILASRTQWHENLIREDVPACIEQIQAARRATPPKAFPLHKYVHHGLSSQALLFNLIGPLLVDNRVDALVPAFAAAGIPYPSGPLTAVLEVEDRDTFAEHKQAQPTSIDLVIRGASGAPLFIECKFVEQAFGGCSLFEAGDCEGTNPVDDHQRCYLAAIGRTYWAKMAKHDFLTGPVRSSPICVLGPYYQFFREVLFALDHGGHFVLLCDNENPVFLRQGPAGPRGFFPFLKSLVPAQHQDRVHLLTIQSVCDSIERSSAGGSWMAAFREKYGISSTKTA